MAQNQVEIPGRIAETPFGQRIPLFASGVSLVVRAIDQGRRMADAVDRFLRSA